MGMVIRFPLEERIAHDSRHARRDHRARDGHHSSGGPHRAARRGAGRRLRAWRRQHAGPRTSRPQHAPVSPAWRCASAPECAVPDRTRSCVAKLRSPSWHFCSAAATAISAARAPRFSATQGRRGQHRGCTPTRRTPSLFPFTDDERLLRELAYRLIGPPYGWVRWNAVVAEAGRGGVSITGDSTRPRSMRRGCWRFRSAPPPRAMHG